MRLGVHRPTVRAGSRLELATLGLAERGHALAAAGRAAPGSALASLEPARAGEQIDAMLGGARPLGPAWWGARLHARALVLSLEAGPHGRLTIHRNASGCHSSSPHRRDGGCIEVAEPARMTSGHAAQAAGDSVRENGEVRLPRRAAGIERGDRDLGRAEGDDDGRGIWGRHVLRLRRYGRGLHAGLACGEAAQQALLVVETRTVVAVSGGHGTRHQGGQQET